MGIDQILAIPGKREIKGISQCDYYSYVTLFGKLFPAILAGKDKVVKMIVNPFGRKDDGVNVDVAIFLELAFD